MNPLSIFATTGILVLLMISFAGIGVQVQGKSFVGNYAEGYEVGKDNGSSDQESGFIHDSQCPPNDSLAWCTGYKVGYTVGYTARGALG